MKPKTLQIHLQKELSRLYDAHEAAAIATRYVTDRFGLSTVQLLLNDDVLLSAAEEEQTQRDVEQLLAQVPVQQVVGFEWFCGHRFRVTADTLIPRPETEDLVRLATERCCGALSNILDVGTGSGCDNLGGICGFSTARCTERSRNSHDCSAVFGCHCEQSTLYSRSGSTNNGSSGGEL